MNSDLIRDNRFTTRGNLETSNDTFMGLKGLKLNNLFGLKGEGGGSGDVKQWEKTFFLVVAVVDFFKLLLDMGIGISGLVVLIT